MIFEQYTEKQNPTNAWMRIDPGIPAYFTSPVVMNELESAMEVLAKTRPQACVPLAEAMWRLPQYEPKKLAVFLLAHMAGDYKEEFIQHVRDWYAAGISEALVGEIIQQSSLRLEILSSREWLNLLESWLLSEDKRTQKIGLRAVQNLLDNRAFQNLPVVFTLVTPLYSDPRITLQKGPDRANPQADRALPARNRLLPHLHGGGQPKGKRRRPGAQTPAPLRPLLPGRDQTSCGLD